MSIITKLNLATLGLAVDIHVGRLDSKHNPNAFLGMEHLNDF